MPGPSQGHIESSCKPKLYEYTYRYRDVAPPASAKTCYKLVAISGGRFVSIYDGCTEYEVGCTMRQEVTYQMRAHSDAQFVTLPDLGATKSWRWFLRVRGSGHSAWHGTNAREQRQAALAVVRAVHFLGHFGWLLMIL